RPQADFAARCDRALSAGGMLVQLWQAVEHERRVAKRIATHTDKSLVGIDERPGALDITADVTPSVQRNESLIVPSDFLERLRLRGRRVVSIDGVGWADQNEDESGSNGVPIIGVTAEGATVTMSVTRRAILGAASTILATRELPSAEIRPYSPHECAQWL